MTDEEVIERTKKSEKKLREEKLHTIHYEDGKTITCWFRVVPQNGILNYKLITGLKGKITELGEVPDSDYIKALNEKFLLEVALKDDREYDYYDTTNIGSITYIEDQIVDASTVDQHQYARLKEIAKDSVFGNQEKNIEPLKLYRIDIDAVCLVFFCVDEEDAIDLALDCHPFYTEEDILKIQRLDL